MLLGQFKVVVNGQILGKNSRHLVTLLTKVKGEESERYEENK